MDKNRFFLRETCLLVLLTFNILACSTSSEVGTEEDQDLSQVDVAVKQFMEKHNVPGLSLAIVKDEKLIYSKAYGKADIESGDDVNRNSLFRIASISKPITGIAVMKLVESGVLSLDDPVFGDQGVLGTTYGSRPYPPLLEQITIEHLLLHTSGNWPNDSTDPMFQHTTLNVHDLIDRTLDNHPVSVAPGTRYAYSNFGYALLGRIIEEITGMKYDEYVKQAILQPAGITRMQIGGNTEADRKQGEVAYVGQGNNEKSLVYAMNITRMDAHGGWIASAEDLARLLVRVDGFDVKPDILETKTIQEMVTASPQNRNYAKGWSVNNAGHWWHNGSLPGSGTLMVRASNGFSWVILTNTRTQNLNAYMGDLDALMWNVLNSPPQWPDTDLF